jgi:hypothetical protein
MPLPAGVRITGTYSFEEVRGLMRLGSTPILPAASCNLAEDSRLTRPSTCAVMEVSIFMAHKSRDLHGRDQDFTSKMIAGE